MTKIFTALLYASVTAAALLAFAWPFVVSRDQDNAAYHVLAVGVLLVFFAALVALCALRLRASRSLSASNPSRSRGAPDLPRTVALSESCLSSVD
jgi:hypothetical protein